jgi:uncharacterized caspase-like protein
LPAWAEKRVALVIGNSAYVKAATLPNPKNDAMAIAGLLRKAGFDVVDVKTDLGADAMRRALRDFSEQVRDAEIAIIRPACKLTPPISATVPATNSP